MIKGGQYDSFIFFLSKYLYAQELKPIAVWNIVRTMPKQSFVFVYTPFINIFVYFVMMHLIPNLPIDVKKCRKPAKVVASTCHG